MVKSIKPTLASLFILFLISTQGLSAQFIDFGQKKKEGPDPRTMPEVVISPNPNDGSFSVTVENPGRGEVSLSLFGMEGQALWHHKIRDGKKAEVNNVRLGSQLETGIYPMVMRWTGGVKVLKVAIKKA